MKTLPQGLLLARMGMGNVDERYLLIIAWHFPAVVPSSTPEFSGCRAVAVQCLVISSLLAVVCSVF